VELTVADQNLSHISVPQKCHDEPRDE